MATLVPVDLSADRQKQVLVLYSTRRDAQIVTIGDRDLPRLLDQGLADGLDYYSEFIDQARFSVGSYNQLFSHYLRLKYQGHQFDLLVAVGDNSLRFLDETRATLFPDVPIVFFASQPSPPRPANATGVTAELELSDTVDLAMALQPDLRHVFVVSGAEESNRAFERLARAQLRRFESRLQLTYLSGLPTEELETRLTALPDGSMVYYLIVDRDGTGANYQPLDYLDRLTGVASAPTYSWVDSAMEHGVVGGSLKDQTGEIRAIAEVALRVLRGEPADTIPLSSRNLNVRQVDWRQLQRWGISEAHLPAGTRIKFREPSAWDRYRQYILSTAAVLLAQTALIAALLLQRARRQRAEQQLRRSEVELRTSYDRIRHLGARLLTAQEAERSRLASELHDDISQQLTLLEIDLKLLTRATPGDAERLVTEALGRAHGITKSMHELSHRLHPARLRLVGLVAALQGLQREVADSHRGIQVTFTHANVPSGLPNELTICLFRTAQEGVQNALKYSRGRRVSVDLRGDSERLILTIADDGVGFDVAAALGKGLGMITMKERLDAIGGTFAVESRPDLGTRLTATAPLRIPLPVPLDSTIAV